MPNKDGCSGVSNLYVFKSRLQEYAQKEGVPTPVYETIKEGPSHEPCFRSTVTVDDVRFDSLPGFFNRKAAEQSAAEVALLELAKSGKVNPRISQPVHETGLCKNLLQEYAQKMNFAIPVYLCEKNETPGRLSLFKCTVEIGGIQYIGASATTKKEAEIKAARTALLAIQSSASEPSDSLVGDSQLTVIPCKKRGAEKMKSAEETVALAKAKKARFIKKKKAKKKLARNRANGKSDPSLAQVAGQSVPSVSAIESFQDTILVTPSNQKATSNVKGSFTPHFTSSFEVGQLAAANFNQSNCGFSAISSADSFGDTNGHRETGSLINGSFLPQIEASSVMPGLNPLGERIKAGTGQG